MIEGTRMMMKRGAPTPFPYDAEVEWISSDGNAWIDTGIVPNGFVPFSMRCVLGSSWVQSVFFGCRDVDTGMMNVNEITFFFGCPNNDRRFALKPRVNTSYYAWNKTAYAGNEYYDGNFHDIQCVESSESGSYNGYALYVDGSMVSLGVSASGKNSSNNMTSCALFAFKFGDSAVYVTNPSLGFKIQSLQLGGLDLIAVRKGQTGYLYDRALGTLLGNAGTGAFTIGPDR